MNQVYYDGSHRANRQGQQQRGYIVLDPFCGCGATIVMEIHMPIEKVETGLAALEAQPSVTRELLMRRIAEKWLEGQGLAYRHLQREYGLGVLASRHIISMSRHLLFDSVIIPWPPRS